MEKVRFLTKLGIGTFPFLITLNQFYDKLFYLTQEARELLTEDQSLLKLPGKVFVFGMHQGYRFLFFYLDEGPNPQVYYYWENSNNYFEPKGVFSEFITKADI